MKIKKLEYYSAEIANEDGSVTRYIAYPNNDEIVNKINEIIEKLNEKADVEHVRHGKIGEEE